jgi:hypothetical protein
LSNTSRQQFVEAVLAAINKRAMCCTLHSATVDQLETDVCCLVVLAGEDAAWLAERKAG